MPRARCGGSSEGGAGRPCAGSSSFSYSCSFSLLRLGASGPGLSPLLSPTVRDLVAALGQTEGRLVDPRPVIGHLVGNMMNQLIFGHKYGEEDEMWRRLQHLREEGVKVFGVCGVVNFLPLVRFWPSVSRMIGWIKEGQKESHREYQRLVVERQAALVRGEEAACVTDLWLEEVQRRETSGAGPGSFTTSQLHHLQADLFGAGTDTSLNTILWAVLLLAAPEHKELQEQLQQELDQECGQKTPHLGLSLPLLQATVMEVMRLRPVVPLGVPHGTTAELRVGAWVVPAGTMVLPLHWAMNMDPEVWDSPHQFRPARFLGPEGEARRSAILPFQVIKGCTYITLEEGREGGQEFSIIF